MSKQRDRFPFDSASDKVLAEAAKLKSSDRSPEAAYLRDVAQSVLEHRYHRFDPRVDR